MPTSFISLKTISSRAAAAFLCLGFAIVMAAIAIRAFGHVTAVGAERPEVAALGVELTGRDPEARFAYALLLEKTLLPQDQTNSLQQYEAAAAMSPNNYNYWLSLARAFEQAGEGEHSEIAARRAAELAPNYARVQWALGNILLRQGRQQEAFAEIRKAVAGNGAFAGPAAAGIWQVLGGDVQAVTDATGESPRINAALALLLVSEKRFVEAADIWRKIPKNVKPELKDSGQALYAKYLEAGMYNSAAETANDIGLFSASEAASEKITNGGFEYVLAPEAANAFSWIIGDGASPRIGLNENHKHSGNYSLLVSFGSGGKGFRPVSQKLGVRPGAGYSVRFFYRSELKTEGKPVFKVVIPASGEVISSYLITPAPDWTEADLKFAVPNGFEGVELRFVIDDCSSEKCTVSGNVWFDDFELSKM